MKFTERASDEVAGKVRVGQDLKGRRREHEREEDEAADPDHEREQH
jgi:predicted transcriptional regulator